MAWLGGLAGPMLGSLFGGHGAGGGSAAHQQALDALNADSDRNSIGLVQNEIGMNDSELRMNTMEAQTSNNVSTASAWAIEESEVANLNNSIQGSVSSITKAASDLVKNG